MSETLTWEPARFIPRQASVHVKRSSFKKLNRDIQGMLDTACPELVRRTLDALLETDDVRALVIGTEKVLDRVQGKATDQPQRFGDIDADFHIELLSEAKQERVAALLDELMALRAEAADLANGIIEG